MLIMMQPNNKMEVFKLWMVSKEELSMFEDKKVGFFSEDARR